MSEHDPCVCLAMLVADKVFREEGTGKSHISGTFSRIMSAKFPAPHDTMHVYLALTDIDPGEHDCEIKFSYLDDKEPSDIISAVSRIKAEDRLQVVEINYCFRRTVFPRPGRLEIAFYMDGNYVLRRRFEVVASDRAAKGGGSAGRGPGG